jgi:hypothetical protein
MITHSESRESARVPTRSFPAWRGLCRDLLAALVIWTPLAFALALLDDDFGVGAVVWLAPVGALVVWAVAEVPGIAWRLLTSRRARPASRATGSAGETAQ